MTDEQNLQTDSESAQGSSDGTQNTEHMIPKGRFDEVNKRAKSAEKRLAELEAAEAARQEDEAKKRGDFDKLISDLKPKAARAAELESTLREYLDAEIADIPEDKRDLIPDGDIAAQLKWVKAAKAKGLFAAPPKAPNMDFAATGDKPDPKAKVTAEEHALAVRAGMTDEQYAQYKTLKRG